MSWSRLLSFYLENKKEIGDLLELESRANKLLPEEVAKFVRNSIEQDIENWNGFRDPKCGVESEFKAEWYVWWTDKAFHEAGVGPCFDIYVTANALLRPDDDEEDIPYIFLEFEGESKGARRKAFEAAVNSTRSKLIGSPWSSSKNILAYKSMDKVITLAALLRPDDLARDIRQAAKEFSETFAPICAIRR